MGLDMYLTAKRYVSDYSSLPEETTLKKQLDAVLDTTIGGVNRIEVEAGYWRKANAIHKWFVDNVQNGVDECQESYLDAADLEKLLITVNQALDNREQAGEILPPSEGFFFGSTNLDEYYFQDLEDTKQILEKIINAPDFGEWDFYYRASW